MKKKTISLILAVILCLGIVTGCTTGGTSSANTSSNSQGGSTVSPGEGPLFSKPVSISIFTRSHPSWPYQDDWYVKKLIKEETNVDLDVTAVAEETFNEKISLVFSSGNLPDMIWSVGNNLVRQYGPQGAFINALDHVDKMPNFKKWYDANTDYALNYLSADGALYQLPEQGADQSNRQGWMYRKDIFDKLHLSVPTNQDEFYNVLKALKKEYPNSYPLTFRDGIDKFGMIAPSWGTSYFDATDNRMLGFDKQSNKWTFGPTQDSFKEMLQFYNKLYKEGLLIPNCLNIDTKGWQDVISNSDSFITLDYLSRIDFFNTPMRATNPEFTMAYMAPPAFGKEGINKFAYSAKDILGFVVSSKTKHLDEVLTYLDWMYSDKAVDLLSWGREGETYKTVNNERKWLNFSTAAEMKQGTGFETDGFYERFNFDAESSLFSNEVKSAIEQARPYDLPQQPVLSYTEDELEIYSTVGDTVSTFVSEEASKFLLGERSFDTWDDYVKQVNAMGVDQLLKIHQDSYDRIQKVKSGK